MGRIHRPRTCPTVPRTVLVLLAAALSIAGAAAPAASAAGAPVRLSDKGRGAAVWAMYAHTAVLPNGSAAVAWTRRRGSGPSSWAAGAVAVRRGAHGSWRSPVSLPAWRGQVIGSLVALGDGRLAVTTSRFDGDARRPNDALYLSDRTGQRWRRASAPSGTVLVPLVRPDGSLLLVATDRRGRARWGVLPRGGTRVTTAALPDAANVAVNETDDRRWSVDARGNVLGVWPSDRALTVSVLDAGANRWSTPLALAASADATQSYDVSAAPGGRFAVAWGGRDATATDGLRNVRFAEQDAGGGWTAPVVVDPVPDERTTHDLPRLAYGPEGPVVVYCRDAGRISTRASQRTDGGWSAPVTLAPSGCMGGSRWFDAVATARHVVATSTPSWNGGWGLQAQALRPRPFGVAGTKALSDHTRGWTDQSLVATAVAPFGSGALVTWGSAGTRHGRPAGAAGLATFSDGAGWRTRTLCRCRVAAVDAAAAGRSAVVAFERQDAQGGATEVWAATP